MQRKTQLRTVLAFAAAICTVICLNAGASAAEQKGSWSLDGSRRSYLYADESAAVGEITIDGNTYLFAPNGVQQVGWQTIGSQRRYFDPETGEPLTGFVNWRGAVYYIDPELGKRSGIFQADGTEYLADLFGTLQKNSWCSMDGNWYHGDAEGKPAAGETMIDGSPFLFTADHKLLTGWQTPSDGITRYYDAASETPVIRTGWLELDGQRYYADAAEGMLRGLRTIDDKTYLFDDSGVMQTGFCKTDEKTVYLAADGALQTGWMTLDDRTYYLDPDGGLQTGMQTIDNIRYDFDADGVMLTGWQTVDAHTYYFDEQGKGAAGLYDIGGDTYYFDESGIMQTGSITVGDIPCFFDADGKRTDGFHTDESGKYYIDPLTGESVTGWQTIGSEQYYFNEKGYAATGILTLENKNYRFTDEGVYHPVKICLDAGHYAKYNRSPVNPVYYESDFNWKMHLYLKEELEKYNITVITTRPNQEEDLPLEDRGKTSEGCDLFLSLHSNASTSAYDDGPLACVTITGTCDQLGLDLANLVADVMGTRQRGSIWKRYGEKFPDLNYYGVLRGATYVNTPAILLEHSYHTNLRATNWLLVDANVRKLAAAEGKFLAQYYGML